ncbi:hypothetical protein NE857_10110 [Nocardiopsis exhalans]|uniref:Uncharacterized protein n=1 Tax=Nocardiopsis exhalans TaxID=163604 RepID=A0ABY5DFF5_9ACTN|nr:hypothetical protein [Nocardiopsis exhalans]USY21923.1 hypothetical protein NE857_10110 [Nocardiopsis exhalans]
MTNPPGGHAEAALSRETPHPEGRGILGRVQRAVDAVLGSSLQEQGLLLDGARNRVVLADAEWALAQSILHQARSRYTLDTTPAVGERSERAAERARAAVEAKAARPHLDASLSALLKARELALEVAALAPGPGSDGR